MWCFVKSFWEVIVESNNLFLRVVIKSFIYSFEKQQHICLHRYSPYKAMLIFVTNFWKWLYKAMYIQFSRILLSMFNSETSRLFSTFLLSPFLKIGVMAATFQLSGIFRSLFIFRRTECLMLQWFLLVFRKKNLRYTVWPSWFCGINIILYISDYCLRDIRICKRGFLYIEIFETEISFWAEHEVKEFIHNIY